MSRVLKRITKEPYNHSSVSLDVQLTEMYSFGRRHVFTPFLAGFVHEDPDKGVFKFFSNTDVLIIRAVVSPEVYNTLDQRLHEMEDRKYHYGYNLLGLCSAAFGKVKKQKNAYYCSEFVAEVLQQCGLLPAEQKVYRPYDFLSVPGDTVYTGKLRSYRSTLRSS